MRWKDAGSCAPRNPAGTRPAGVRLGHAQLAHGLAAGVEEHVPADQRLAELRRSDDLMFTYVDAHSSVMAEG